MTHLDRVAARLAPLSTDPKLWICVDIDFRSEPLGLSITLEPARRGLRDKRLGVPLLGWQPYESELRKELESFNERTREPDAWYISMTLTVYTDGTFSHGASRHAPRKG